MSNSPVRDPVVTQPADRAGELRLVGRDGTALARRHDLARMEREAAHQAERPAGCAAVRGAERAGRILEEDDVLRHRRLELLPLDRTAEEVDREHGPRARGHRLGDELGADEERLGVDVDEHRPCLGRARPRSRWPGTCTRARSPRRPRRCRGRAARGGSQPCRTRPRPPRPCRPREREPLEGLDLRPHRQLTGREHLGDGRELRLAHVRPREPNRLAGVGRGRNARGLSRRRAEP